MLVREVGECIDVLNHYKPRDGAWTAAVFREVLGDCIGALQRVQSFLDESITRVARVPPDDEQRELRQLLMQTVRKVPQADSGLQPACTAQDGDGLARARHAATTSAAK